MSSQEYGSSSSRSRQHENPRPSRTLPHSLRYKGSVEDYFLPSTRFLNPSSSSRSIIQKSKTLGAPTIRSPPQDIISRPLHSSQKQLEPSPRPPTTADKFLWAKGELIGRGSHGKVYLGFNATTGELMAVKQVEVPSTADDRRKAEIQDFVQTLRRERETLMDLDHPNIVGYLGFEENPETVNIFLQYVSGGTIGRCLADHGPLNEEVTKSFTQQILDGISYLHSNGIIHRDLKSDNILVEPAGVCKISDFGISAKSDLDRAHSGLKGTFYWMAPEMILLGTEGYNSKVDIWSVGCIAIEMWTAKRPWYNEMNIFKVMEKLSHNEAPPLPPDVYLSTLADHFRKECFTSDPRNRPSAKSLLIHPYLQLPQGWTFPGMEDMGNRAVSNPTPISEFEGALSGAFGMVPSTSASRPSSPALTMSSGTLPTISTPPRIPPRPVSPQLVTIDPPPPRKLPTPQSPAPFQDGSRLIRSESLQNQGSSHSSADSTERRKLYVHNPATIPDLTKSKKRDLPQPPPTSKPFVYEPPPLPDITSNTPYSNSLSAQSRIINPPAIQMMKPSKLTWKHHAASTSTLSLPAMSHRMGPANLKDVMAHVSSSTSPTSYSEDDGRTMSSSYSGWQKPPPRPASSPLRRPSLPPTPVQRNIPTSPVSPHRQNNAFGGATRPDSRQVLEHMTVYFPGHDLDEPLVSSPIEPRFTSSQAADRDMILSRRFTMKSLKSIAEEQIHKDGATHARRQTRLWGNNIEEIKGYT